MRVTKIKKGQSQTRLAFSLSIHKKSIAVSVALIRAFGRNVDVFGLFVSQSRQLDADFRWVPRRTFNSATSQMVVDPTDTVPPQVVFKLTGEVTAVASAGSGVSTDKAKASTSVMGVDFPAQVVNTSGRTDMRAGGSVTRYLVVQTNGATEIQGPWVYVLARAEVEGGRMTSGNTPAEGYIKPWVNGSVVVVYRGVGITSTIDQSYRKATSQPVSAPTLAPLPGSVPPVWKEPVPPGEPDHSLIKRTRKAKGVAPFV